MLERVVRIKSHRMRLVILPVEQYVRQILHVLQWVLILVDIKQAKSDVLIIQKRSYLLILLVEFLY